MSDFTELTENDLRVCTCGRSATGFCTGLHRLTEEEWDARVFDESFMKEENSRNEQ
jgi:CDGSH-type Zn-finger protein